MASEQDAADAAARLEAALERIARLARVAPAGPHDGLPDEPLGGRLSRAALISRLDRTIERLRDALDQGA